MKGVLTAKIGSAYRDMIEERYHFPKQKKYLRPIEKMIGDEVIFYESRRNRGRSCYIAVAQVVDVIDDQESPTHCYAIIDYFQNFIQPVPFNLNQGIETSLFKEDGSVNPSSFQQSIRMIPDSEFAEICKHSFSDNYGWPDRRDVYADTYEPLLEFEDNAQAIYERPIIQITRNVKKREEWFKHAIRKTYDRTCSFTGLRLINGKGRPEVEAAHIRPVSENGPDSIRNGIALSGTVHWMFDRGLLSLENDFTIMESRHLNYDVSHLLNADKKAKVPEDTRFQPHPHYLEWHRENVFKH